MRKCLWLNVRMCFFRSRCGGDSSVAEKPISDEPIRVRDLQQGVPARPEPPAPPPRPQLAVEAPAADGDGGEEAGLRVSRADLRAPRPETGAGRSDGDKEALLPETRGEEVEV